MKINLSKFFRYILIILINILCIFVLQYYINLQFDISKSLSNLKIAIFVNVSEENSQEVILSKISDYSVFKSVDIITSGDNDKFEEITPELNEIIPKETISFPTFLLVNKNSINSMAELTKIKDELSALDFVDDVVYDKKAYDMFFNTRNLLNKYKDIFKIIFYIIILLFVLKFLFFLLKDLYKDIMFEIVSGILLAVFAYMIICLMPVFSQNPVFMLNWQILYIVTPLSLMFTLLTKESNA
ncbi:MAG: hypothetical protein K5622_06375 [Endomicrobiaceae bacterium]|nr:hypothetical protein [Endomicrobiaceae bacterium]